MTIDTKPPVPHYVHAPLTKENLTYADLGIVDLAKAATAEGRAELAATARDALHNIGFFYVVNHGLSQPETERMFDIADVPFSQVPEKDKLEFHANIIESGSFQGYKPRKYWHVNGGVQDEIETYNLHRDVTKKQHPQQLKPYLPEIAKFTGHNHDILNTILRLLAIGLELPEDTFVDQHGWDDENECYLRFMKYYPRTAEDEEKAEKVWLKGHTDGGSITVLWSQPVSALQILSQDGQWKWIRHMDNALVVNAGDCMEFLSGGFYKATIHRVIQPPVDQQGYTRLGILYFATPNEDIKLLPASGSPVLERVGIRRRFEDKDAPTVEVYRKGRTAAYGKSTLKQSEEKGIEEEIVSGVVVKHYN
ncbi:Clavaminate synthase-like protein [Irpex rosettiformis]|uniref:Clavaminate synthase-like protein n=1 Tax=Irpex rosettiformis TaxID=378272 RepID=A0ACB8U5K5_9APHY|nr:Clavaminate synthase-like protein [Irpex rosettiformis]